MAMATWTRARSSLKSILYCRATPIQTHSYARCCYSTTRAEYKLRLQEEMHCPCVFESRPRAQRTGQWCFLKFGIDSVRFYLPMTRCWLQNWSPLVCRQANALKLPFISCCLIFNREITQSVLGLRNGGTDIGALPAMRVTRFFLASCVPHPSAR